MLYLHRATLDLNLRHINLEKKTTHDIHSRKVREKDRDLRNLKKAELHLRVTVDSLQHTQQIHEKTKGNMDAMPKDDGSQVYSELCCILSLSLPNLDNMSCLYIV